MFNFSYNHTMGEIRNLAGENVVLVGNIPPRDIMASGGPADVEAAVNKAFAEINSKNNIIWSVGGGMAPETSSKNIEAFIESVRRNS